MTSTQKSELKTYVIDSKDLEKKVEKIIRDRFKNDKDIERHIVDIIKNVMGQLFKELWIKRNIWKPGLSNKVA
jgi:uncharacterized protein (DUF608 family)